MIAGAPGRAFACFSRRTITRTASHSRELSRRRRRRHRYRSRTDLPGARYRSKSDIDDSDGPLLFGLGIHGQYVFVDNTAVNGKAAGATRWLFLGDTPAESGAMVPMVAGTDQLVGHLLLLGRQAGIERLECRKKTGVVVGPHFRKLLAQLEVLDCVRARAVLPCGGNSLIERLGVLAHCRLDLLPLRLLRRRDLEF